MATGFLWDPLVLLLDAVLKRTRLLPPILFAYKYNPIIRIERYLITDNSSS